MLIQTGGHEEAGSVGLTSAESIDLSAEVKFSRVDNFGSMVWQLAFEEFESGFFPSRLKDLKFIPRHLAVAVKNHALF